jgi:glycosyltransferase involved in cell wall biosynthesis
MLLSSLEGDIIPLVNSNVRKVKVLLATCNGVSFLDEQLTSLSEQRNVDVEVLVNDDGSIDGTLEILWKWRDRGLIVSISESVGLGSTKAFLKLLQECDEEPYVAFCDQDDIWEKDKLTSQLNFVGGTVPMMSTCSRIYIDDSGNEIGKSKVLRNLPSFENACFENIAPGNTILLNNAAIKIINSVKNPPINHYDSWIYLLISTFGKVNYSPLYLVRYRLHSANSVGLRKISYGKSIQGIKNFLSQQKFLVENKFEFLSPVQQAYLGCISSFVKERSLRRKFVMLPRLRIDRQSHLDRFALKFLLLFVN